MSGHSLILFFAAIIGFFVLLHIFHHINDKRNEERRKARVTRNAPIVKSVCDSLIKKAIDRYPNIPFGFKPECDYVELVNSYTYSTVSSVREVASRILPLIAEDMVELYKEYEPDFVKRENLSLGSSRGRVLSLPQDWPERRKLVFERDNRKCRRCGTEVFWRSVTYIT